VTLRRSPPIGDVFYRGDVLLRVIFLFHREKAGVADHVGVGEQPIGRNHPSRAAAAADGSAEPWRPVIRLLRGVGDASHTFSNFVGLGVGRGSQEGNGEGNLPKTTGHECREDVCAFACWQAQPAVNVTNSCFGILRMRHGSA